MATKNEPATDAATPELSYEQARAELAEVVTALESGGASLTESVGLWRRAEKLADICQYWLDGAKAALEQAAGAANKG
ncbi:MAG: exodeoxyribonuclease VII small subunit [Propionibacteriaceae bacterium]|nr:exodeoxyribonuclease VII small subunit [Propionibacteriaceae bacterium]